MFKSVCAASVKVNLDSPWQSAIAIMENPGVYDVKVFVLCETGEVCGEIWDYRLYPDCGCLTMTLD